MLLNDGVAQSQKPCGKSLPFKTVASLNLSFSDSNSPHISCATFISGTGEAELYGRVHNGTCPGYIRCGCGSTTVAFPIFIFRP